jgi:hypothetical protein
MGKHTVHEYNLVSFEHCLTMELLDNETLPYDGVTNTKIHKQEAIEIHSNYEASKTPGSKPLQLIL